MEKIRVYFEEGRKVTFAVALDWPGWCRKAAGDEAALEAMEAYRGRYLAIAEEAALPHEFEVVGHVPGNATTDFGAPDAVGPWDETPMEPEEIQRQALLVASCWRYFDSTAEAAPAELRKGPRGGGRDTAGVISHVREAERAYASKLGIRVAPRTSWEQQRSALGNVLATGARGGKWPPGYAMRRIAWHVLDHAWEIQDKGDLL